MVILARFRLLLWLVFALPVTAAQPNIVVFLVDDMGLMDSSVPFLAGADGKPERFPLNDFYKTPNMERLAARGVRFSQFEAMSVCSPSRVSLMTGRNAARHRTTNWINAGENNAGPSGPPDWNWEGLKKSDVTLPGQLRAAGYRTIHVGKAHFGPKGSEGEDPENIGFDVNIAGSGIGHPASYFGTENFGKDGKQARNAVPGLEKYHGQDIFLTEALTQEALAQIDEAAAVKKPFFLHLAHYAVHTPFQSDPRFAASYADSGRSKQAQAFATLIEGMDKSLGDVLDRLEKLGIADNTLVVFLGDNGSDAPLGGPDEIACSAPLRGKKGSHYEGGTRAPLITAWAAENRENPNQKRLPVPKGELRNQVVAVYDLFPTILGVAEAKVPEGYRLDGRDFSGLLAGTPSVQWEDRFLMHYPHSPHRSDYFTVFREGPWKVAYHYFPKDGPRYELFDLSKDPSESNNLAEAKPEELRRMMKALKSALEEEKALYPISPDGKPVEPVVP